MTAYPVQRHCAGPAWSEAVPSTYILPDLPWAVLLAPIVRDARSGDILVVYTDAMLEHVEQVVHAAGRDDLVVRQVEPPPFMQVA